MTQEIDDTWWVPYTPDQLKTLLKNIPCPYWLAGGYALELFLGYAYRSHGDIDILIQHKDQLALRETLPDHHFFASDPPGHLRPWSKDELLPQTIDNIWVKEHLDGPFVLQVMLLKTVSNQWIYKRNPTLRGTLSDFGIQTPDGTPIIAPEIQLLYKSRNVREKDQLDFDTCLPRLNEKQCIWLMNALEQVHPDHIRIDKIRELT